MCASRFARILPAYFSSYCLHIFRHIAQVLLGGRQPAGVELVQSDEKPDGAICAKALCGVALRLSNAPTLLKAFLQALTKSEILVMDAVFVSLS